MYSVTVAFIVELTPKVKFTRSNRSALLLAFTDMLVIKCCGILFHLWINPFAICANHSMCPNSLFLCGLIISQIANVVILAY